MKTVFLKILKQNQIIYTYFYQTLLRTHTHTHTHTFFLILPVWTEHWSTSVFSENTDQKLSIAGRTTEIVSLKTQDSIYRMALKGLHDFAKGTFSSLSCTSSLHNSCPTLLDSLFLVLSFKQRFLSLSYLLPWGSHTPLGL
jgi:hypothetical protein